MEGVNHSIYYFLRLFILRDQRSYYIWGIEVVLITLLHYRGIACE